MNKSNLGQIQPSATHTYGKSRAGGRKLCLQRLQTAGQDYSLGSVRGGLWQLLAQEGSSRSRAGWHTLSCSQSWVYLGAVGWLHVLPELLPGPARMLSAAPLPVLTLHPGREMLQESGLPLGINSSCGIWTSRLDVGAGSSAVGISAHGTVPPPMRMHQKPAFLSDGRKS